jgi:hypothetical protein
MHEIRTVGAVCALFACLCPCQYMLGPAIRQKKPAERMACHDTLEPSVLPKMLEGCLSDSCTASCDPWVQVHGS